MPSTIRPPPSPSRIGPDAVTVARRDGLAPTR